MTIQHCRLLPVPPAGDLPDAFALFDDLTVADSWLPGPPPGLDPAALAIDAQTAAEWHCGGCGWTGGLAFAPFHKPDGRYKAVVVCPGCHASEEL
jgi:hypothetical protein